VPPVRHRHRVPPPTILIRGPGRGELSARSQVARRTSGALATAVRYDQTEASDRDKDDNGRSDHQSLHLLTDTSASQLSVPLHARRRNAAAFAWMRSEQLSPEIRSGATEQRHQEGTSTRPNQAAGQQARPLPTARRSPPFPQRAVTMSLLTSVLHRGSRVGNRRVVLLASASA